MSLNLNLSMYPLTKPLSQFLHDVSKIKDNLSKLSEIDGYVGKLEEERKKIQVFKRELPLCMLLLNEAIETLKEEASSVNVKLDVGEGAKLETDDKKNWMSSAQLWISNSNNSQLQSTNEEEDRCASQTPFQTCNKPKQGGAILSFNLTPPPPPPPAPVPLCLITPTSEILTDYSRTEQSPHIQKKDQRRRWSEDLHRSFVDALQRIGGSHVATPKQIRDIMKVDGLTIYKMHTRKNPLHSAKIFLAPSGQPRDSQKLISLSRSDSPQGPLVDRGLFSNNADHSSEEEEKSDGRSWKSESRRKRQGLLDLEL